MRLRYSLSTEVPIPRKYLESVLECRIMVQAVFLFSQTHTTDAFKTPSSSFLHKPDLLAHRDVSRSFRISALFQCSAEPTSASTLPMAELQTLTSSHTRIPGPQQGWEAADRLCSLCPNPSEARSQAVLTANHLTHCPLAPL